MNRPHGTKSAMPDGKLRIQNKEMQNMQNKEKSSLRAHQQPSRRVTNVEQDWLKSPCFGAFAFFCHPSWNKIQINYNKFSWRIFARKWFVSPAELQKLGTQAQGNFSELQIRKGKFPPASFLVFECCQLRL